MKIYLDKNSKEDKLPCQRCKHKHFEQRFGEDEFGSFMEVSSCKDYCERLREYESMFA